MAEEPPVMSIQQRIASLNQAHWVGRGPNSNPPPRQQQNTAPAPVSSVSRPSVPARNDFSDSRNGPTSHHQKPPPPARPPTAPNGDSAARLKAPPPLPGRNSSTQRTPGPSPSLPPRRPPGRRNSGASSASETSLSTTASASPGWRTPGTSSSSPDSCVHRVLAPAWGEAALPPLPPKGEQTKPSLPSQKVPARPAPSSRMPSNNIKGEDRRLPSRPASRVSSSNESARPNLPPQNPSTDESRVNGAPAFRCPSRRSSGDETAQFQGQTNETNTRSLLGKLPPPPVPASRLRSTGLAPPRKTTESPERPDREVGVAPSPNSSASAYVKERISNGAASPVSLPARTPAEDNSAQLSMPKTNETSTKPPIRKLPPPVSGDTLRPIGFAALRKNTNSPENSGVTSNGSANSSMKTQAPNGVPPPVPLSSRPDLSKIQATKPRFNPGQASSNGTAAACLKCRDYSSPDAHAAQFPRESLPSYNIGWLANQLTAPFPSLTDKARVIFTWLHHNVAYDVNSFFNGCVKPSTPSDTIATGLAVCEGYAGLFTALASHAGMEARVVSGHGKGFGFQELAPGSNLPPFEGNHAWNVVKIDNGQWKLIDSCWGAGVVQGAGQPYAKLFNPSMFTDTNDEFGMRHFPGDRSQFYRDDGRPEISWEEYLRPNPHPMIYTDAMKHSIGERTFQPAVSRISVRQPGPIRIQFGVICPHWTLEYHSKQKAGFFLLNIHGIDGRRDERIPFNHFQPSGPRGGGDTWYVDIADPRVLGAPGQTLQIVVLTSFGDRQDARGLTMQEYQEKIGRVGMAWAGVAQWDLV